MDGSSMTCDPVGYALEYSGIERVMGTARQFIRNQHGQAWPGSRDMWLPACTHVYFPKHQNCAHARLGRRATRRRYFTFSLPLAPLLPEPVRYGGPVRSP